MSSLYSALGNDLSILQSWKIDGPCHSWKIVNYYLFAAYALGIVDEDLWQCW